ncbi:MAG: universal stress protein [Desulfobacterales bacterium]
MKILVGYNGSAAAQAALELARDHARAMEARLIVVTSTVGGPRETADDIAWVAGKLNEARLRIESSGVRCEVRELVRGMSAGEDLVRFAADNAVDLIYVGVEKKSKTQKMILGSNAQYVILKAPCPVMTVKEGLRRPLPGRG